MIRFDSVYSFALTFHFCSNCRLIRTDAQKSGFVFSSWPNDVQAGYAWGKAFEERNTVLPSRGMLSDGTCEIFCCTEFMRHAVWLSPHFNTLLVRLWVPTLCEGLCSSQEGLHCNYMGLRFLGRQYDLGQMFSKDIVNVFITVQEHLTAFQWLCRGCKGV
jgi:hypothetical protein